MTILEFLVFSFGADVTTHRMQNEFSKGYSDGNLECNRERKHEPWNRTDLILIIFMTQGKPLSPSFPICKIGIINLILQYYTED